MKKARNKQAKKIKKLIRQRGIRKDKLKELMERGDIIIRVVTVDYTRTPKEAIKATRRVEHVDDSVVKSMPVRRAGIKEDVEVEFFNLGKRISDDDLVAEYEKRGLQPDPHAVAAVNEADPEFADEYPNSTHWKDHDDKWCFVAFRDGCSEEGSVGVNHSDNSWPWEWWLGGVSK